MATQGFPVPWAVRRRGSMEVGFRLFLGGASDGDGGTPLPDGDGGVSGDAGTPTPDGDGGISGDGGTSGSPRILRRIRDVRIENAILRFRGGSDADGG